VRQVQHQLNMARRQAMARPRLRSMHRRTIGRARIIGNMTNAGTTDMEKDMATVDTIIGQAAIELGMGVSPAGRCKTAYANPTEVISPSILNSSGTPDIGRARRRGDRVRRRTFVTLLRCAAMWPLAAHRYLHVRTG
jgi:hypothetical protein